MNSQAILQEVSAETVSLEKVPEEKEEAKVEEKVQAVSEEAQKEEVVLKDVTEEEEDLLAKMQATPIIKVTSDEEQEKEELNRDEKLHEFYKQTEDEFNKTGKVSQDTLDEFRDLYYDGEFVPQEFEIKNVFGGESGLVIRFSNKEDERAYQVLSREYEEQKAAGKITNETADTLSQIVKKGTFCEAGYVVPPHIREFQEWWESNISDNFYAGYKRSTIAIAVEGVQGERYTKENAEKYMATFQKDSTTFDKIVQASVELVCDLPVIVGSCYVMGPGGLVAVSAIKSTDAHLLQCAYENDNGITFKNFVEGGHLGGIAKDTAISAVTVVALGGVAALGNAGVKHLASSLAANPATRKVVIDVGMKIMNSENPAFILNTINTGVKAFKATATGSVVHGVRTYFDGGEFFSEDLVYSIGFAACLQSVHQPLPFKSSKMPPFSAAGVSDNLPMLYPKGSPFPFQPKSVNSAVFKAPMVLSKANPNTQTQSQGNPNATVLPVTSSKMPSSTKPSTSQTPASSFSEELTPALRDKMTVNYEGWDQRGSIVLHGTADYNSPDVASGPQNIGNGYGGRGLYVAINNETGVANEYAWVTQQNSGNPNAKAIIMEGQINPNNPMRVGKIQIVPRGQQANIAEGIFPCDWYKNSEIQTFIHENFDVIEVHGLKSGGYSVDTDRFLVFHKSAGQEALKWLASSPQKPISPPITSQTSSDKPIQFWLQTPNSQLPSLSNQELSDIKPPTIIPHVKMLEEDASSTAPEQPVNKHTFFKETIQRDEPVRVNSTNAPNHSSDPSFGLHGQPIKLYESDGVYYYAEDPITAELGKNVFKDLSKQVESPLLPLVKVFQDNANIGSTLPASNEGFRALVLPSAKVGDNFSGCLYTGSESQVCVAAVGTEVMPVRSKNVRTVVLHETYHAESELGSFDKHIQAFKDAQNGDPSKLEKYYEYHNDWLEDRKNAQALDRSNLSIEEIRARQLIFNGPEASIPVYMK